MATNAENHLIDSAGNVAIDFVWGNMAMQPNDQRGANVLNYALDTHNIVEAAWNGFPTYVPNTKGTIIGGVVYVVVPNVLGATVANAQAALVAAEMGTVTLLSAYTPAVSSVSLTTNAATLLSTAPHGFAVGDTVTIGGLVDVSTNHYSDLNGSKVLISGTSGSTLVFSQIHADLPTNTSSALGAGVTAKVSAKNGLIQAQSIAAGASSVSTGTPISLTPYYAS